MTKYLTLVFRANKLNDLSRQLLIQLSSAASWSHAIDDRKAAEKEREELRCALELVTNELESWKATEEDPESIRAIQIGKQAIRDSKGLSLAEHDAEVIEKLKDYLSDIYCGEYSYLIDKYIKKLRQKAQEVK